MESKKQDSIAAAPAAPEQPKFGKEFRFWWEQDGNEPASPAPDAPNELPKREAILYEKLARAEQKLEKLREALSKIRLMTAGGFYASGSQMRKVAEIAEAALAEKGNKP